jgi:copper chaperone CopZ
LPLLLVAFGVSAASVSAAFEKVRPLFLTVSTILLAAGFYLVYVRREACAAGSACTVPDPKLKGVSRTMLWVATACVLAFAFFPKYAGFVLGKTTSREVQDNASGSRVVTLAIEGMTCEACAITIQKALAAVPGVGNASVVFTDREAHIILDQTSPASNEALIRATAKAGYIAKLPAQTRPAP